MEQPGPSTDPQEKGGLEVRKESEDQLDNRPEEKDDISLCGEENTLNLNEDESTINNEQEAGREEPVSNTCGNSTVFSGSEGPSPVVSGGVSVTLATPQDVVETAPPAETIETSLTNQAADSNDSEQPSLSVSSSSEPSPVDSSDSSGSPSSVQSTSKNSSTDSSTTSGICNGPSTPSSPASSPHTRPDHLHSASSPFDTDCSRKLISQIQRTLSQESLLDELESELLNCQLLEGVGERKRKGSPPVNGLPADQKGCMVAFEKCVQDKCTKQEKAIQR